MARMVGKAEKQKGCPYGCCDPDFTKSKRGRRKVKHMWKSRERRRWRREVRDELT